MPIDIIFVLDAIAGGANATEYHHMLTYLGLSPDWVNAIISVAEVVRIALLAHRKR